MVIPCPVLFQFDSDSGQCYGYLSSATSVKRLFIILGKTNFELYIQDTQEKACAAAGSHVMDLRHSKQKYWLVKELLGIQDTVCSIANN